MSEFFGFSLGKKAEKPQSPTPPKEPEQTKPAEVIELERKLSAAQLELKKRIRILDDAKREYQMTKMGGYSPSETEPQRVAREHVEIAQGNVADEQAIVAGLEAQLGR